MIEPREDRNLFARLMIVSKSCAEINLKEVIGRYEFSIVPRSMSKSELIHILEKISPNAHQHALGNFANNC